MASSQTAVQTMVCDGCGMAVSPEHVARRLKRLELSTRYRPIHIQAVFLGAQSPALDTEFLYSGLATVTGEALQLLRAAQIETAGRETDTVLSEFQRKGFFLAHFLECPPDNAASTANATAAMKKRLPAVARRLRGSLRPKHVIPVSSVMALLLADFQTENLGGTILLDNSTAFDLNDMASVTRLTSALRCL